MAIKNITNTEINATAFTWNGDTIATQAWVNANVGTPTLDAVTTAGNTTTNNITVGPSLNVGEGISTNSAFAQFGNGRTGNGYAYIDLVGDTTYTDYGLRVLRGNGGVNSYSEIVHRGTGTFTIETNEAAPIAFKTANAERMRITSGGDVGIGTTDPSSKLHVNYEDAESVLTISRGGTNLPAGTAIGTIQFNADYQGSPISYGSIDMYANSISGVRSSLDFNVKSTSGGIQTGLTIQGNNADPKVGIGTTSPAQKLHVEGGTVHATGGTNNGKYISVYVNDSWGYLQTDAPKFYLNQELRVDTGLIGSYNEDLQLRTSATTRMTINNTTGNVGIGTTAPSTKLEVSGVITATGGTSTNWNTAYGWGNHATAGYLTTSTAASTYLPLSGGTLTGNLTLTGVLPQAILDSTAHANLVIDRGSSSHDANLMFKTAGVTNFRLWLDQSDALGIRDEANGSEMVTFKSGGNLGIGTTSPAVKLHVSGTAFEAMRMERTTAGGGVGAYFKNGNGISWLVGNGGNNYFGINLSTSNFGDQFTITDTGNVGIGTTSPAEKLSIATDTDVSAEIGRAHVGSMGHADYAGFSHIDQNGTASYALLQSATGTTFLNSASGKPINFRIANSDKMVVSSSGNVGIGTTSPGYVLEVNGDTAAAVLSVQNAANSRDTFRSENAAGTRTFNIGNDASGHGIALIRNSSGTTTSYLAGSGNSYLNGGNVGIGTTSPGTKLDVDGNLRAKTNISLGEVGVGNANGRSVLIEGAANASNGEGAGRIFFSENNNTATHSYGLSLYYEGDPNIALPSGFQPNTGNATWSLRRHDNSVNGVPIMSGSRTNSNVQFGGNITIGSGVTLSESTDRADLLSINSSTGGWGGLQITNTNGEGIWSFMVDGSAAGIYDDQQNEWAVYCVENSYVQLRYNGSAKLTTTSVGADVTGTLNALGGNVRSQYDGSNYSQLESNASGGVIKATSAGTANILLRSYGESHFNGGNVGIGTTAPTEKLEVSGNILASGDITAFSDANLKENVETVSDALDKVKGMRGVTFNKVGEDKRSVGVIAQELLEVLPEAVHKSGEHYSVAYGNIVGVLIEAMKEQQAQIDELKAMINGSTK